MEISEAEEKQEIASVVEEVRKRNEHQPHAQGPCCTTVPGQLKAIGKTLSCACRAGVCRMHGARGGAPEGKHNGNYRHGARSKETNRALEAHQITTPSQ
jgi:hypothetical protein